MKAFLQKRFRKYVSKLVDPDLPLKIGNQEIQVPLSHPLRNIIPLYPDYNYNLGRLLSYLEKDTDSATLIDIGANIGDTVAYVRNYTNCPVLCIDGNEKYFKKLQKNLSSDKNVEAVYAIVADEKERGKLVIHSNEANTGTPIEGSGSAPVLSLPEILSKYPKFQKPTVIKTDTDGFDTIILRGCKTLLEKVTPVLFFEYDPHFIKANGDDPASFLDFLVNIGYSCFILYTNVGDLLCGVEVSENKDLLYQITDFFSGRNILSFADIAAYPSHMKEAYADALKKEQTHFAKARGFVSSVKN